MASIPTPKQSMVITRTGNGDDGQRSENPRTTRVGKYRIIGHGGPEGLSSSQGKCTPGKNIDHVVMFNSLSYSIAVIFQ